jgi:hypothetical protein
MDKNHVQRLKKKHQFLLFLLKMVGARERGMGFKVMKFHAVLHLWEDIMMFGVPMVVDTGSNESHHKTTKIAAKLTQKEIQTFEKQTSDRLDDFLVLDLAVQEINGRWLRDYSEGYYQEEKEQIADKSETTTGGMMFHVFRDEQTNEAAFQVMTRMKNKGAVALDPVFLQYAVNIQEHLAQDIPKIPIFAEHTRSGQIFRAHPNYRGKGPWRDWVMIQWEEGDFPAKIWGFFDLTALVAGRQYTFPDGIDVCRGVWAVVETVVYVKDAPAEGEDARKSELFQHIVLDTVTSAPDGSPLERKFYMVDVESFKQPAVVIPNVGTKSKYLLMTPRDEWSEQFIDWIKQPHQYEVQEMNEEE